MTTRAPATLPAGELVVEPGQRVVAVPHVQDGREVVRYVVEVESPALAATTPLPESVHVALNLAGAWDDLDWDEAVEALDHIRHQSRPTPPIEPNER